MAYSIQAGAAGKYLGNHLLVEYYNCNAKVLNNQKRIKKIMRTAAEKAGATIVSESFHRFSPWGISGVVVIMESHISIHTWPECGYAAVDLFTCGTEVSPDKAFDYLSQNLSAEKFTVKKFHRGSIKTINSILKNSNRPVICSKT